MKKLTITYIGTPIEVNTKNGPRPKNSIKASEAEYQNNYLGYFVDGKTKDWKVGDVIEVEDVVQQTGSNGKTYWNIVMPKISVSDLAKRVETLENAMAMMKLVVKSHDDKLNPPKITGTNIDYPTPESEGLEPGGVNFDTKAGLEGVNYDEPPF